MICQPIYAKISHARLQMKFNLMFVSLHLPSTHVNPTLSIVLTMIIMMHLNSGIICVSVHANYKCHKLADPNLKSYMTVFNVLFFLQSRKFILVTPLRLNGFIIYTKYCSMFLVY